MSQQQKVKSKLHHNFLIPGVQILPFIDGGGNKIFLVISGKIRISRGKFGFEGKYCVKFGVMGLR